jgi:hypothetical protein
MIVSVLLIDYVHVKTKWNNDLANDYTFGFDEDKVVPLLNDNIDVKTLVINYIDKYIDDFGQLCIQPVKKLGICKGKLTNKAS